MKARSWMEWIQLSSSSRQQAELIEVETSSRWFVWGLSLFIIALVIWSCLTNMDQSVNGSGRLIPTSRVQQIQSLDGGTLKSVHVKEGAFVKAGDLLLQIDETRYHSSFRVNESELESLQVSIARLEAEQALLGENNDASDFSERFSHRHPQLVAQHKALMNERIAALNSQVQILDQQVAQRRHELLELKEKANTLSKSLQLANEELSLKKPLAKTGVITRVEIIGLERKVNDLQGDLTNAQLTATRLEAALAESTGRRNDLVIRYRADLQQELQETRDRQGRLLEGQSGLQDRVRKASLYAPVDGLVKTVSVHTEGSVIQPGSTVIEIVPVDESLVFEARVQPADIAFLHQGQTALIKLTAYEFAAFGSLKGHLETISADTLDDEKGQPYYRLRVALAGDNKTVSLLPGMTGTVDIVTGQKRVVDYLLTPVLKAFKKSAS